MTENKKVSGTVTVEVRKEAMSPSAPAKEKTPLTKTDKPLTDRVSGWKKALKK
jgi:hypothetical protein